MRVFIFILATVSFSAMGTSVRFDMKDAGLRNLIHFVSDAPLEKTVGISNFVSGWLELDPERLIDGVKGEFEADVRTFQTGIDSRNEQLREKFFAAADYPLATFTISKVLSVSKARLQDGVPLSIRLEGLIKAKGVVRPQIILAKVVYLKESEKTRKRLNGNLLKVSASFDLDIQQFNVPIPENMVNRFSRYVQVYVDLIGSDRTPASDLNSELARLKK